MASACYNMNLAVEKEHLSDYNKLATIAFSERTLCIALSHRKLE